MRHTTFFFLAASLLLFISLPAFAGTSGVETMTQQQLVKTIGASKGKVVLINFWATWCGPCRREIPELMRMREQYSRDDVVILGISLDFSQGMLEKYVEKTGFNYPIYKSTKDVGVAFDISAIPKTVIYDRSGVQVVNHDGYLHSKDLEKTLDALIAE